jgi:hypothetical protein
MIDQNVSILMDSLVRPLLDNERRELDHKERKVAEWAVQAGVSGSQFAFFKRIATHHEHYKELGAAVWAAMLRIIDETVIGPNSDLSNDLKQKFDAYMSTAAQQTRSTMVDFRTMVHDMPKESFDTVYQETRTKFHNEIDLRCQRGSSSGATQITVHGPVYGAMHVNSPGSTQTVNVAIDRK